MKDSPSRTLSVLLAEIRSLLYSHSRDVGGPSADHEVGSTVLKADSARLTGSSSAKRFKWDVAVCYEAIEQYLEGYADSATDFSSVISEIVSWVVEMTVEDEFDVIHPVLDNVLTQVLLRVVLWSRGGWLGAKSVDDVGELCLLPLLEGQGSIDPSPLLLFLRFLRSLDVPSSPEQLARWRRKWIRILNSLGVYVPEVVLSACLASMLAILTHPAPIALIDVGEMPRCIEFSHDDSILPWLEKTPAQESIELSVISSFSSAKDLRALTAFGLSVVLSERFSSTPALFFLLFVARFCSKKFTMRILPQFMVSLKTERGALINCIESLPKIPHSMTFVGSYVDSCVWMATLLRSSEIDPPAVPGTLPNLSTSIAAVCRSLLLDKEGSALWSEVLVALFALSRGDDAFSDAVRLLVLKEISVAVRQHPVPADFSRLVDARECLFSEHVEILESIGIAMGTGVACEILLSLRACADELVGGLLENFCSYFGVSFVFLLLQVVPDIFLLPFVRRLAMCSSEIASSVCVAWPGLWDRLSDSRDNGLLCDLVVCALGRKYSENRALARTTLDPSFLVCRRILKRALDFKKSTDPIVRVCAEMGLLERERQSSVGLRIIIDALDDSKLIVLNNFLREDNASVLGTYLVENWGVNPLNVSCFALLAETHPETALFVFTSLGTQMLPKNDILSFSVLCSSVCRARAVPEVVDTIARCLCVLTKGIRTRKVIDLLFSAMRGNREVLADCIRLVRVELVEIFEELSESSKEVVRSCFLQLKQ